MTNVVTVAHRLQAVALEASDDDGDVVGSAALVSTVDEPLAGGGQITGFQNDSPDLVGPQQSGEAIAAQDEHVAAPDLLMREVYSHVRFGAQRLKDDVAPLAHLRFFLRHLAGFDKLLHQRLVLRYLTRDAAADEVPAAVTHVCEVESVAEQPGDGRRRAHAAILRMLHRVRVDDLVRDLRRLPQRRREERGIVCGRIDPAAVHFPEDDIDGHGTRQLSSRGTAHPVGHHEQRTALPQRVCSHGGLVLLTRRREVSDEERILVVLAREADICPAEHVYGHGAGRTLDPVTTV